MMLLTFSIPELSHHLASRLMLSCEVVYYVQCMCIGVYMYCTCMYVYMYEHICVCVNKRIYLTFYLYCSTCIFKNFKEDRNTHREASLHIITV